MMMRVVVWVCFDLLPIFSQRYLWHLFSQPAVMTLLLNVAGVAHVVDAASLFWSQPANLWRF